MAAKRKSAKKEKLDIEVLAFQVRRLANELDGVGKKLKAVSVTAEELMILLGEMRAVRHLLDPKGEFKHLDRTSVHEPRSSGPEHGGPV